MKKFLAGVFVLSIISVILYLTLKILNNEELRKLTMIRFKRLFVHKKEED